MTKEDFLAKANAASKNTLMETLEIVMVDFGDDFLVARMPVTSRVHQPDGVLHGGATAALAAGIQPTLIRVLGRWSSDIYEIYCRLSLEAAAGMGALIGSTPFEDVEQGEFVTEELEATSFELAAMRHVDLDPESEEEDV